MEIYAYYSLMLVIYEMYLVEKRILGPLYELYAQGNQ
jgi:hypothetical protein